MEVVTTKPKINTVSLNNANQEYSFEIPDGVTQMTIKMRSLGSPLQIAFDEGQSGTTYKNLNEGESYTEDNLSGIQEIFFRSPDANQTVEILTWNK